MKVAHVLRPLARGGGERPKVVYPKDFGAAVATAASDRAAGRQPHGVASSVRVTLRNLARSEHYTLDPESKRAVAHGAVANATIRAEKGLGFDHDSCAAPRGALSDEEAFLCPRSQRRSAR